MKVFPLLQAVQVTNFPAGGIYLLFVDTPAEVAII